MLHSNICLRRVIADARKGACRWPNASDTVSPTEVTTALPNGINGCECRSVICKVGNGRCQRMPTFSLHTRMAGKSHDLPVVGRPMSDAESQIFEPQVRTGSYFSTEPNNLLPLRSRRQSGGLACFRQLAGVAIDRGVAAPRLAHLAGRWIIQLIYLGRLARPLVYLGSQRAFGRLAQWLEL